MAVTAHPGPILEFLTTTTLPFHEVIDDESRRIVRSHAIRYANRRKQLGPGVEGKAPGQPLTSAVPAPQSKFTTRFRLDTKASKRTPKSKSPSKNQTTSDADDLKATAKTQPWRKQALTVVPGTGILDPFEAFPIKLGTKQQALIHYRMLPNSLNLLACFADGNCDFREGYFETKRLRPLFYRAIFCPCSRRSGLATRYLITYCFTSRSHRWERHLSRMPVPQGGSASNR